MCQNYLKYIKDAFLDNTNLQDEKINIWWQKCQGSETIKL